METLGKFFAAIVMIMISIIVGGFFLMKLWGWFVIPAFPTLPVLTFQQAMGLSVFLSIMVAKRKKTNEDKDFSDVVGDWLEELIFSCVVFGIAWIIYLFIQ
jgi:hypothetical protein